MPVPSWVATAFFGVDGEDYNDKIDWAENKFSFQNKSWSYLVFSLEFIKGLFAVSLLTFVHTDSVMIFGSFPLQYLLAFVVVLGHTFPIYNEFNRSRSMGTYFGIFAGLWLLPAMISLALFLVLWAVYKKVNFSSLIISLGSLLMFTFILSDLKAFVIAIALTAFLVLSSFQHKVAVVKA
jgi:glycerol-3-phosphate acyltransferase PlsY